MGQGADTFSYTVGGIALTGTAYSVGTWINSCLPDTQMQNLDGVFVHTRQVYDKSDAEGLLPGDFKVSVEAKLAVLERSREELRERTYHAITFFDQVVASVQGLSRQIMQLSDEAKFLRAEVVTKSEESRRLREGINGGSELPDSGLPMASDVVAANAMESFHVIEEPRMPPTVYCQPTASEATLVQPIAQIGICGTAYAFREASVMEDTDAKPHWFTSLTKSSMWSGRSRPKRSLPDIESGA